MAINDVRYYDHGHRIPVPTAPEYRMPEVRRPSIGEVVDSLRVLKPEICWEANEEFSAVCVDAQGHSGPCGWGQP